MQIGLQHGMVAGSGKVEEEVRHSHAYRTTACMAWWHVSDTIKQGVRHPHACSNIHYMAWWQVLVQSKGSETSTCL